MKTEQKLHDDHVHLRRHTAIAPPHDLARVLDAARYRGVIPGIREHAPLPRRFMVSPIFDFGVTIYDHELEPFIKQFADLNYPMGLEQDYIPGAESEIESGLKNMESLAAERGVAVSGILGSIHFLPTYGDCAGSPGCGCGLVSWDLDAAVFTEHLKRRGPEQLIRDYFGAMLDLVGLGIYDALGHIELLRKFDMKNSSGDSIYFSDHEKLYDRSARGIIERISETDMAIEINTAGFFKPIGRPYISQELLNYAVELGVPICLGSDAHEPEHLGERFDFALGMIETAGCDMLVTFDNREIKTYSFTG